MGTVHTEERLLEATQKLIAERGYLGATTREIAREAGVSELTLFRHFGSKERLFKEVLNRHTFLPRLKGLLPELERLSYEEALTEVATRFLLTLKSRKAMVKIMYAEINLYPEKIKEIYNKFIIDVRLTLAHYFRSLQKKGVLRRVSPELAARAFLGTFFSYFRTEEIIRGNTITKHKMEKTVRELVDIFVHGTMRNN